MILIRNNFRIEILEYKIVDFNYGIGEEAHDIELKVKYILLVAIVLIAIESIMNIHIIAGARGWGFYAQLLAGAVGGFAFSQLFKATKNQKAC